MIKQDSNCSQVLQPLEQFEQKLQLLSKYKTYQKCLTFKFNNKNTILIVGERKLIQVYQFSKGVLKYIQTLTNQKEDVTTLEFFKSKSNFISGSDDASINIWSQNLYCQTKYIIKLQGHQDYINCLVLHKKEENLIVSGSSDKTLKFWNFKNNTQSWSCTQTISEHKDMIFGLSINQDGNRVISCDGNNNIILVLEGSNVSSWKVMQKIETYNWGFRLSFIDNDLIAFQPTEIIVDWRGSRDLVIYSINPQHGLYTKSREIPVFGQGQYCSFFCPSQYVDSRRILLSKNGCTLNLIRFTFDQQNSDFEGILECAINFGDLDQGELYASISDDGEYLITWDPKSREIQIRRFHFQN